MVTRSRAPMTTRRASRKLGAARTVVAFFTLAFAVVLAAAIHAYGEDAPPTQSPSDRPHVPMASIEGPTRRIEGKIMRSSRGKKGPVRLLVERKDGDPVTVLVAPEDVCDRLGLSLKADEQVVVEGSLLKSERPIMIATAFIVGDKTIRVRDADGKLLGSAPSSAPAGSSPAAAAVTGTKKPQP